jgi:hypothetical protein
LTLLWDLKFEEIICMPPLVSCEERAYMPGITPDLAGRILALMSYDFTFEWPTREKGMRCVTAIAPPGVEDIDEFVLGSAFLRTPYWVFDLDTNTVECKLDRNT